MEMPEFITLVAGFITMISFILAVWQHLRLRAARKHYQAYEPPPTQPSWSLMGCSGQCPTADNARAIA